MANQEMSNLSEDINSPQKYQSFAKMEFNMDLDWKTLANLLRHEIPFHFSKLSVGECQIINNPLNSVASRGAQVGSMSLAAKLHNCFYFRAYNYFIGIPCPVCYNDLHNKSIEWVGQPNTHVALANTLINSNYVKSMSLLSECLSNRNVVVICSTEACIEELSNLDIKPVTVLEIPSKNAWSEYEDLKDKFNEYTNDGDVVLFMCGPLGRVLCSEWYRYKPTLTCIELGSFFDPFTQKSAFMYHQNVLPECSVCNPQPHINTEDLTKYDRQLKTALQGCKYFESLNFQEWETFCQQYNHKYAQIGKIYEFLYNTYSNNFNIQFYCLWMQARCKRLLECPFDEVYDSYKKCYEAFPYRLEGIWEFLTECKGKLNRRERFDWTMRLKDIWKPNTTNCRWVNDWLYEWMILNDILIEAYYVEEYQIGVDVYLELKKRASYPDNYAEMIENNSKHYFRVLQERSSYETFQKELDVMQNQLFKCQVADETSDIFHFVYLSSPNFPFVMMHYLSVKTAHSLNHPSKIFIYVNEEPIDNIWWDRVKQIAQPVIVTPPKFICKTSIWANQHICDLMRIHILERFGGVYMDLDVLSLKSVKPLIASNKIVMCKEEGKGLANCVIISPPNKEFFREWIEEYETKYNNVEDFWVGLSVRKPGELQLQHVDDFKVLEQQAFLPHLYCDYRMFDGSNCEKDFDDSYVYHAWQTELNKTKNMTPSDMNYFETHDNAFTRLFRKYI